MHLSLQDVSSQNWKFGVQASSILSMQRIVAKPQVPELNDAVEPLWSFSINGYVSRKISEKWFASCEPGFIRKGEIIPYNHNDPSDDTKLLYDYSQLILLGHFSIVNNLFVSFGPEISYLHRVKAKSGELENDISKFYDKKIDFSGIAGVGVSILHHVDIEFRYNHSFNSYHEMPFTDSYGNVLATINRYNQYLQLLLRIKI